MADTYDVTLDGFGDVRLFRAAVTVRDQLRTDRLADHVIDALEKYINGAILQERRIEVSNGASMRLEMMKVEDPSVLRDPERLRVMSDQGWTTFALIFLDVHFYCICVDKAAKLGDVLLGRVGRIVGRLPERDRYFVEKLRLLRRAAAHALDGAGSQITDARNFLEHFDEKLVDGMSPGLSHRMGQGGHTFEYGDGKKVTIGTSEITHAYGTILEYIRNVPISA